MNPSMRRRFPKSSMSPFSAFGLCLSILLPISLLGPPQTAFGAVFKYKRTNSTGKDATDLKLTFNKDVSASVNINKSTNFTDTPLINGNMITFSGRTVANGTADTGSVKFSRGGVELTAASWSHPVDPNSQIVVPLVDVADNRELDLSNGFIDIRNEDIVDVFFSDFAIAKDVSAAFFL